MYLTLSYCHWPCRLFYAYSVVNSLLTLCYCSLLCAGQFKITLMFGWYSCSKHFKSYMMNLLHWCLYCRSCFYFCYCHFGIYTTNYRYFTYDCLNLNPYSSSRPSISITIHCSIFIITGNDMVKLIITFNKFALEARRYLLSCWSNSH